jgi:hypothetical protein
VFRNPIKILLRKKTINEYFIIYSRNELEVLDTTSYELGSRFETSQDISARKKLLTDSGKIKISHSYFEFRNDRNRLVKFYKKTDSSDLDSITYTFEDGKFIKK